MPKIPVKLTKGEIVLPPHLSAQHRARLEEMNKEGLLARNMGGVAQYKNNGGFLKQQLGSNPDALGKLGQSLVAIGQRDFGAASAALTPNGKKKEEKGATESRLAELDRLLTSGAITQSQYDKQRKIAIEGKPSKAATAGSKKQQALKESDAQVVTLAEEARGLLGPASEAGDLINGYVKLSEEDERSITEKAKGFASSLIQTAAGAFDQTRKVREEARRRIVSASHPDSYKAYQRLTLLANQMVLPVLASGALGVNPTDADVKLAKEAQFDIEAPSNTWEAQLVDLINRSGGSAEIAEQLAVETGNEEVLADPEVQVNIPEVDAETDSNPLIAPEAEPETLGEKIKSATGSKFKWREK